MSMPIHQWAEDDRPREKFLLKGKFALTDAELLAILIGSGSKNESAVQLCQRILAHVDDNLCTLGRLSIKQLTAFKGIGEAKALSIAAALELGKRRRAAESIEIKKITSSNDVFRILQPLIGDLYYEEFWVLYLNNNNQILHKKQLSRGGINGTVVDVRMVFQPAFEYHATAIIVAHNHPSGKLKESQSDLIMTNALKQAGKLLQINVLDHLIITERGYFSFQDEGVF